MPSLLVVLIICLASSSFDVESQSSISFISETVSVVLWVFGAAAIVVAVLLFKHRKAKEEVLRLVIFELVCTVMVGLCLLIQPILDARLDHFREEQTQRDEASITSFSNRLSVAESKLNEAANTLAQAKQIAAAASNTVNNANIAVAENLNRHLSQEQKLSLLKAISPFQKGSISFEIPETVPDGMGIANDLANVFVSDGWKIGKVERPSMLMVPGVNDGLIVSGTANNQPLLSTIADVLNSFHLITIADARSMAGPRSLNPSTNDILFMVLYKPQM